jgi:UDP-N-acetylmuramate dehydrogenase
MRTGGDARFFCVIKNLNELKEAVVFCKDNSLKFFVLGGGSNTIFSDGGFDGLIIKNEMMGRGIIEVDNNFSILKCGAGENWDEIVSFSIKNKLYGLENLSNIPGTVGASAVQNIGAYGAEVKDFIEEVEVLDIENFTVFSLSNKDCNFEYRNSLFKNKKTLIVLSASYKLSKKFFANLKYSELKNIFSNKTVDNFSVDDIRNKIIDFRKNKLPEIKDLGSAGSFFKNPILTKENYKKLLEKFPLLPKFDLDGEHVKIPLGFVLDKICLLKGYRKGDVGVYEKQALVIVNYGKAKTSDIKIFSEYIKNIVKEKTGLFLEEEVEFV